MADYILPDNRLTDEQRNKYWFDLEAGDAESFMSWVLDQFPAVYDDAVINTGRIGRLRALKVSVSRRAAREAV